MDDGINDDKLGTDPKLTSTISRIDGQKTEDFGRIWHGL